MYIFMGGRGSLICIYIYMYVYTHIYIMYTDVHAYRLIDPLPYHKSHTRHHLLRSETISTHWNHTRAIRRVHWPRVVGFLQSLPPHALIGARLDYMYYTIPPIPTPPNLKSQAQTRNIPPPNKPQTTTKTQRTSAAGTESTSSSDAMPSTPPPSR